LRPQVTTLWEYPSQHYGKELQGDPNYRGATPSYVIWNLLKRYTRPGNTVVDPCAGSGTTLDVAADLKRKAVGFDVNPTREDIRYADARKLPLGDNAADFVFIDPPYATHLEYSDDPACIGKLDAGSGAYYQAMEKVIAEIARVLKPDRYMGLYVSDSYEHGKGFHPLGFELFGRLREHFTPVDIISVVRHNKTLKMGNYRKAAEEGNFFLRGFNYLFIMYKPGRHATGAQAEKSARKPAKKDWRPKHKRKGNRARRHDAKKSSRPGRGGKGRRRGSDSGPKGKGQ
jgi:DNA modification methylase